jgi:hypothetical protein
VSPTKATTTNDDAAKKQHVLPADFDEFVTTTASGLGDGWTVDPDNKPHPGLSAYLIHSDGRRVGLRHIWQGAAVQTWALDVPPRTFDNEADAEAHAWSVKQLTAGTRYNVGVCFTNNPPAATTARNIRTRLLPSFEGQRSPLRAFPKGKSSGAPTAAKATATAEGVTEAQSRPPAKKSEPPAKKSAPRSRTKSQSAAQTANSKKSTAPARPRRTPSPSSDAQS